MVFNPEDGQNFGPHCRNCHKGSSGCGGCHTTGAWNSMTNGVNDVGNDGLTGHSEARSANDGLDMNTSMKGTQGQSDYRVYETTTKVANMAAQTSLWGGKEFGTTGGSVSTTETALPARAFFRMSQTVTWTASWRAEAGIVGAGINTTCSDDGFSWPHRTLGWKMLKDDLFGLDFIGPEGASVVDDGIINVGETRSYAGSFVSTAAHDIDSVCLDCHNPTIWNASSALDHVDSTSTTDNYDDELILRGLP